MEYFKGIENRTQKTLEPEYPKKTAKTFLPQNDDAEWAYTRNVLNMLTPTNMECAKKILGLLSEPGDCKELCTSSDVQTDGFQLAEESEDTTILKYYLECISDLLNFRDVYSEDYLYMYELGLWQNTSLYTKALYVLTPGEHILFTPKLRYYSRLLENKVNRYLNEACSLMEEEHSEPLSENIPTLTREAVWTSLRKVSSLLMQIDPSNAIWENLSSDSPHFSEWWKPFHEKVVFFHNAMAELVRCWLEVQDRYARLTGKADGLYDVYMSYSSIAFRLPDMAFDIKRVEEDKPQSVKKKVCPQGCSYLYNGDSEYFNTAIQEFTNKLINHKLIKENVDYKTMLSLFGGRFCEKTINWIGQLSVLTAIIKRLSANHIITTRPETTGIWQVAKQRFLCNGQFLPDNVGSLNFPTKQREVIDEIVKALSDYKKNC